MKSRVRNKTSAVPGCSDVNVVQQPNTLIRIALVQHFTLHKFSVCYIVVYFIVAYVQIVRIPEGSMHIRVTETQLSKNYLGNSSIAYIPLTNLINNILFTALLVVCLTNSKFELK